MPVTVLEQYARGVAHHDAAAGQRLLDSLEALEFKAARSHDPTLAAIKLLLDLNRSGKRDVPADAPMPFRKEWKRLVTEEGQPSRRL